jgi:hypothetical protein
MLRTLVFRTSALALVVAMSSAAVWAGDKDFDAVVGHLKKQYAAKKTEGLPFVAKMALKFAHPAGLKSFRVTVLEELQGALDNAGLDAVIRDNLTGDWQPIVRIYSRKERQQTYVYLRTDADDAEFFVVAVDDEEATVVKVKLDVDKLADWVANSSWSDFTDGHN